MNVNRAKQLAKKQAKNLYRGFFKIMFGHGKINKKGKGRINLIDVGAIGNLPSPWFEHAGHIKNLLAFEPNDKSVKGENHHKISKALWSKEEEREFYIYNQIDGSSLYEQNREYVAENFDELKKSGNPKLANSWMRRSSLVKTEKMQCTTLDSVIEKLESPIDFNFIKIDCQGAEYEILQGAKKFLETDCIGLHLELFRLPMYKGIKLLPEVSSFLESYGFQLAKKFPPHGTFDSQNDCLFLKSKVEKDKKDIYQTIEAIYGL